MSELAVLPSREEQRSYQEIHFKSFSSLRELPAEPDWLREGYLVPGSLTMLAGHPFAGKSMMVSGLLKAIEAGDSFLGRSTKRASAILISEEDESALRARGELLGLLELQSQYLSRSTGAFAADWPELIAVAAGRALCGGHSLLVVDTFPGLAGLGDEQENDAGAIAKRLRPLQEAAGMGLKVRLESLQADARSGNCLHMDAFCTATNCTGVHRSAASPYSQRAPRGAWMVNPRAAGRRSSQAATQTIPHRDPGRPRCAE